MKINMSAADIRVFLAENLPYYEAEDGDDFLYIVTAEDIERVSLKLYRHLTSVEDGRAATCLNNEKCEYLKKWGRCYPDCLDYTPAP